MPSYIFIPYLKIFILIPDAERYFLDIIACLNRSCFRLYLSFINDLFKILVYINLKFSQIYVDFIKIVIYSINNYKYTKNY
jgi:hypothetical protein